MIKPRDCSKEPIAARLENWAACQRGRGGGAMTARETRSMSRNGGGGNQCMTDVVCTMLKEKVKGAKPGKTTLARMDFADAARVQSAYQQVSIRHQLLLKDLYVLGKSVNAICRALSIKHASGHHWNGELKAAQEAIEDIVNGADK